MRRSDTEEKTLQHEIIKNNVLIPVFRFTEEKTLQHEIIKNNVLIPVFSTFLST